MEIDKTLVERQFSRAACTYDKNAVIQHGIAERLMKLIRLNAGRSDSRRIMELGAGTGYFSRMLYEEMKPEQMYVNDISSEMLGVCMSSLRYGNVQAVAGDAEMMDFPFQVDMIASCSVIQWFNDQQTHFGLCHDVLDDEGLLAFATFGPDNMKEVRSVSGKGLRYYSLSDYCGMLSEYEVVCMQNEKYELHFDTPADVLRHMKNTGVNSISGGGLGMKGIHDFCRLYEDCFGHDGRVPLTYDVIYCLARKK